MIVWLLVIIIALVAGFALFYAGRAGSVNASARTEAEAQTAHQRNLLSEIEADVAAGRLSEADAAAAKAELAREVIRTENTTPPPEAPEDAGSSGGPKGPQAAAFGMVAALVVAVALGTYAMTGAPWLPGVPLAGRVEAQKANTIPLDEAVAKVEAQMKTNPDDIRGWQVLAPVYMQTGRFEDAANAYRNIIRLEDPVKADARIDLAEALIMADKGVARGEAMEQLQKAVAADPSNQRGRFYIASEATRAGDFKRAITLWQGLIDSASGGEPWLDTAKRGLAFAKEGLKAETEGTDDEASGTGQPAAVPKTAAAPASMPGQNAASDQNADQDQQEMINDMVQGLADRLAKDGGSVDEWLRLVRSRLVLGDKVQAQNDYDTAKAAYPDPADRVALDALAAQNGLK